MPEAAEVVLDAVADLGAVVGRLRAQGAHGPLHRFGRHLLDLPQADRLVRLLQPGHALRERAQTVVQQGIQLIGRGALADQDGPLGHLPGRAVRADQPGAGVDTHRAGRDTTVQPDVERDAGAAVEVGEHGALAGVPGEGVQAAAVGQGGGAGDGRAFLAVAERAGEGVLGRHLVAPGLTGAQRAGQRAPVRPLGVPGHTAARNRPPVRGGHRVRPHHRRLREQVVHRLVQREVGVPAEGRHLLDVLARLAELRDEPPLDHLPAVERDVRRDVEHRGSDLDGALEPARVDLDRLGGQGAVEHHPHLDDLAVGRREGEHAGVLVQLDVTVGPEPLQEPGHDGLRGVGPLRGGLRRLRTREALDARRFGPVVGGPEAGRRFPFAVGDLVVRRPGPVLVEARNLVRSRTGVAGLGAGGLALAVRDLVVRRAVALLVQTGDVVTSPAPVGDLEAGLLLAGRAVVVSGAAVIRSGAVVALAAGFVLAAGVHALTVAGPAVVLTARVRALAAGARGPAALTTGVRALTAAVG
ncbi:hypothetical protein GCM10022380_70190 [Amycolatopsis tucumanensis]|uniref:Uncharacterized protein n=1 Tax=Amycolatopsis tucumanensis TaxID=401106 RepID=A0ABP7JDD9_9PSEU